MGHLIHWIYLDQLCNSDALYEIEARVRGVRDEAALLWGPKKVEGVFDMRRYVHEMLNGEVEIVLKRRIDGKVLFSETGTNAGLEIEF